MEPFGIRGLARLDSLVALEGSIRLGILEGHLGATSGRPFALEILFASQTLEILLRPIHYNLRRKTDCRAPD